jgi:AraC-like DNA-binding protein
MDVPNAFLHNMSIMFDELTLLHADHRPKCIASVDKHFTYHTIQMMSRGQVELFYDDQRKLMRGKWCWPCHPGPTIRFHEYPKGRSWDHRYIAFTGPMIRRWDADGLLLTEPIELSDSLAHELADKFDRMLSQMNRPGRWGQAHAINLLQSILLDLAQCKTTVPPNPPVWLNKVCEQLGKLEMEPDYHALAESLHLSLTTLRRHFKQTTGTTLHQYRLDLLITEARKRLGHTDTPIKQIADELGYQDVYYFTRQFTQAVGISPARFRRSRQA